MIICNSNNKEQILSYIKCVDRIYILEHGHDKLKKSVKPCFGQNGHGSIHFDHTNVSIAILKLHHDQ